MKWVHFLHRDMSVLFDYFAQIAGVDYLEETLQLSGFQLKGRKIDHSEIYHDANELIEFGRRVEARGQSYLEFLTTACEAQCKKLVQVTKASREQDALEAFDKYCEEQTRLMVFLPLFPGVIEPIITKQLDEIVQKYAKNSVFADKLVTILQKPSQPYTITKEEIVRYQLGAMIQREIQHTNMFMNSNEDAKAILGENVELNAAVQEHIAQFGWVETRHFKGKLWSIDDVIERIRKVLSQDCKQSYSDAVQSLENQEAAIRDVYHQLGFSKKDKSKISTIRDFIYLRTQRKDSMSESAYHIQWALEEIARKAGLEAPDLVYLMPNEITDLAQHADKGDLYQLEITKRKKGFALITYDGETRIFTDEFESRSYHDTHNERRVTGICTFPGEVRAQVRKILRKDEIETTQDGEVIVTPTTSPDYVVIIGKLKGIVTNEGGVTCHAAQISREYKIPCIIGTGNATNIFDTGDTIHLNAREGYAERVTK